MKTLPSGITPIFTKVSLTKEDLENRKAPVIASIGSIGVARILTQLPQLDRGMAFEDNISEIIEKGYHYIVATRRVERNKYLEEFEKGNFHLLPRSTSLANPTRKKPDISIEKMKQGDELCVFYISDKRSEKNKAIREFQERELMADLKKLAKKISTERLKKKKNIYEAIGRIKERYPRVARYYRIEYDSLVKELSYRENAEKKSVVEYGD